MGKVVIKKSFAKLEKGQEVELLSEGASAYKVKRLDGADVFVPKSYCEPVVETEVEEVTPESTSVDVEGITVSSSMSDAEKEVLMNLMSGDGKLKTRGIKGKDKDTPFEPPLTQAQKEELQQAKRLKKKRKCLVLHTKPLLEPYQFWLTDLTEGRLPDSGVDRIIKAHPYGTWDEEGPEQDIPDIMVEYKWDPNVLEAIAIAAELNEKILITGLPGTGKTTGIQQYAAHTLHPYMRFNGKDGIEQSSFLGYPWATSEGMEWKDGLLPQGLKEGYLVCIDEVFKIPAGIQMAMQNLYEKDGSLMLDDKPGSYHDKLVKPAPEFRLMLTDNVRGTGDNFEKFASTQVQDTSTLDRFNVVIEQHYLKSIDEVDMLFNMYPESNKEDLERLVKFAGLVRNGYKDGEIALTLSPRGLCATLLMMRDADIPLPTALKYAFINKLAEDSEIQAVDLMMRNVGGLS